jgi:addiction module RelE/StbE family toxin
MSYIIWTPTALRDLRRLYDFLSTKSPEAAQRAIRIIRQGIKPLSIHPEMGRPVDESPDMRELVLGFGQSAYVALYRYNEKQIVILAVRHGREAGY